MVKTWNNHSRDAYHVCSGVVCSLFLWRWQCFNLAIWRETQWRFNFINLNFLIVTKQQGPAWIDVRQRSVSKSSMLIGDGETDFKFELRQQTRGYISILIQGGAFCGRWCLHFGQLRKKVVIADGYSQSR